MLKYLENPEAKKEDVAAGREEKCTAWFDSLGAKHWREVRDNWDMTRRQHNKEGGREYYHCVFSINPNDPRAATITDDELLDIGRSYVERWAPGHDFAIYVHRDKEHPHVHTVWNTVNYETGLKWRQSEYDLQRAFDLKDEIDREHGLQITERSEPRDKIDDREMWLAARKPDAELLREELKVQIEAARAASFSLDEFKEQLEARGISVRERGAENPRFTYEFHRDEKTYKFREDRLGTDYGRASIKDAVEREEREVSEREDQGGSGAQSERGIDDRESRASDSEYDAEDGDRESQEGQLTTMENTQDRRRDEYDSLDDAARSDLARDDDAEREREAHEAELRAAERERVADAESADADRRQREADEREAELNDERSAREREAGERNAEERAREDEDRARESAEHERDDEEQARDRDRAEREADERELETRDRERDDADRDSRVQGSHEGAREPQAASREDEDGERNEVARDDDRGAEDDADDRRSAAAAREDEFDREADADRRWAAEHRDRIEEAGVRDDGSYDISDEDIQEYLERTYGRDRYADVYRAELADDELDLRRDEAEAEREDDRRLFNWPELRDAVEGPERSQENTRVAIAELDEEHERQPLVEDRPEAKAELAREAERDEERGVERGAATADDDREARPTEVAERDEEGAAGRTDDRTAQYLGELESDTNIPSERGADPREATAEIAESGDARGRDARPLNDWGALDAEINERDQAHEEAARDRIRGLYREYVTGELSRTDDLDDMRRALDLHERVDQWIVGRSGEELERYESSFAEDARRAGWDLTVDAGRSEEEIREQIATYARVQELERDNEGQSYREYWDQLTRDAAREGDADRYKDLSAEDRDRLYIEHREGVREGDREAPDARGERADEAADRRPDRGVEAEASERSQEPSAAAEREPRDFTRAPQWFEHWYSHQPAEVQDRIIDPEAFERHWEERDVNGKPFHWQMTDPVDDHYERYARTAYTHCKHPENTYVEERFGHYEELRDAEAVYQRDEARAAQARLDAEMNPYGLVPTKEDLGDAAWTAYCRRMEQYEMQQHDREALTAAAEPVRAGEAQQSLDDARATRTAAEQIQTQDRAQERIDDANKAHEQHHQHEALER